jgi:hypothetical protein
MNEPTRLGDHAAQAFADRSLIDWYALRRRAHVYADRRFVANLHLIAAIRSAAAEEPGRESVTPPAVIGLVTLVAGAAAVHTMVALTIAMAALVQSDPVDVSIPQIELALAFGFAGVLLATAVGRDRRSLFLLAAFLTASNAFAHTAVLDLSWAGASPWMRAIDGCATDAFTPACLMLFALDFPRVHRFRRFDVAARRACFVMWVLGGLFFIANLALDARLPGAAALAPLYREHPGNLFWRVFTLGLALPVVAILVRVGRAPAAERGKVARIAAAIGLGSAPFLVAGLLRTVSPDPERVLAVSGIDDRWLATLVMAGFMAIPVLSSGALLVDRPFDVAELQGVTARLARSLRRRGRGPRRDPRRDLPDVLRRLRSARGVRELEAQLAHELRHGMGASRTRLFLRTADDRWESTDAQTADLPKNGAVVAMLEAGASLVDLARAGSIWPLLPHADRQWARSSGVLLAASVGHRDGALAAIIAIEGSMELAAFEAGDRWFVAALAPVVAALLSTADGSRTGGHIAKSGEALEAAFECSRCGDIASTRALVCGCNAPPVLAALPVLVADKFLVQRRLGRGGMGIVYLARDVALDRDVVLKTLPAPGPGRVAGLRREARAMAAIRHEALATIHGLEMWRDTPVLVVEHFPCGTLADRLLTGPLPRAQALRLALDLASALAHMHARGLLHRDIKPANIALTEQGSARLLDFGLAVVTGDRAHAGGSRGGIVDHAAGTPAYAAPETRDGAEAAAAGDLWSLSVVVLEVLTGANPIRRSAGAPQAGGRWPFEIDMARVAATLDPIAAELVPFFMRALALDPASRYQTADEWREALQQRTARMRSDTPCPRPPSPRFSPCSSQSS